MRRSIITFSHKGDFKQTVAFLNRVSDSSYIEDVLNKYGKKGVNALKSATPKDTGETSESWTYEIRTQKNGNCSIVWSNTNTVDGVPVVILLQYGHATKSGAYIEGKDFINPAIQPIFDEIVEDVWKEVSRK